VKKLLSLCSIFMLLFAFSSCSTTTNPSTSITTSEATTQNTTAAVATTQNTTAAIATTQNTTSAANTTVAQSVANEASNTITLATTTSTQDSGLLDYLLPEFTKDTGIAVKVVAVGTGQAIKLAQDGNADCLLVHAKSQEEKFVADGYGTKRIQIMYNDFILVGPKDDPLGIKTKASNDVKEAFTILANGSSKFVSRGDGSGTETKEKAIWTSTGIDPTGKSFYVSAGKGMGDVLIMTDEMKAYTLSDRATYLSMKDKLDLQIVCEKVPDLLNQYSIIRLNYDKLGVKNKSEAEAWIAWMFSDKALQMINNYGVDKYGEQLFITNPDPNPLS